MTLTTGFAALPERSFFREQPDVTVARPVLHLSLFLADGRSWAVARAGQVLARFLAAAPVARLRCFRASPSADWRPLEEGDLEALPARLSSHGLDWSIRRLFRFELVDDPWAPSVGFRYREVDDSAGAQHGYVQLVLPPSASPDELLALTLELVQDHPVWAATAGLGCTFNPLRPRNAFTTLFAWCKRWLGMGVPIPEVDARHIRRGLTEVAWLTYASSAACAAWRLDADRHLGEAPDGAAALSLRDGVLLRAARAPEAGDVNLLGFPTGLAWAARALDGFVLRDLPPFPGGFGGDPKRTEAWRRRFLDGSLWIND